MLARQRADGLPLLLADAVDHELGEAAVVVGHAEGGVLGVEQFAGGGDDRLEHVAHLQVPAHGEDRAAHGGDPGARPVSRPVSVSRSVGHGFTVPAGGDSRIGPPAAFAWAHRTRAKCPRRSRPLPEVARAVRFLA